MNLVEQKKLAKHFVYVGVNGVPLTTLWESQRAWSKKRPAFWKVAMQISNKIFLQRFNDARYLDKSFHLVECRNNILLEALNHRRPKFCSIKDFWDRNLSTFLRPFKNLSAFQRFVEGLIERQVYSSTGPPKGFVPLPDVEIGGCARNDSLIAPLVN